MTVESNEKDTIPAGSSTYNELVAAKTGELNQFPEFLNNLDVEKEIYVNKSISGDQARTSFYQSKEKAVNLIKWVVAISIPVAVASWIYYLSYFTSPIASIEKETSILSKTVERVEDKLNEIEKQVIINSIQH